jgi:hypothetical protein
MPIPSDWGIISKKPYTPTNMLQEEDMEYTQASVSSTGSVLTAASDSQPSVPLQPSIKPILAENEDSDSLTSENVINLHFKRSEPREYIGVNSQSHFTSTLRRDYINKRRVPLTDMLFDEDDEEINDDQQAIRRLEDLANSQEDVVSDDRELLLQQRLDRELFGGSARNLDRPPSRTEIELFSQNADDRAVANENDADDGGALFSDSDDDEDEAMRLRRIEKRLGKRPYGELLDEPDLRGEGSQLSGRFSLSQGSDDEDELLQLPRKQREMGSQASQLTAPDTQSQSISLPKRPRRNEPGTNDDIELPKKVPSSRVLMEERARKQLEAMKEIISVNLKKKKTSSGAAKASYTVLPAGNYRQAKTTSEKLLYFPIKSVRNQVSTQMTNTFSRSRGLLSRDIHVMLRDLESERLRVAQEESAKAHIRNRFGDEHLDGLEDERLVPGSIKDSDRLWVDKYSPRMYIDLVGDEVRQSAEFYSIFA